ncbi:hypothetical protein RXV86_12470 [Alisedimentitalea sp. MJ-SS2]|uniref:hypothetical protein n=1 Tax=Aliisedimentitalea sp. MJ-SS2 TaxID=3049795 RepID=UPI002914A7C2|nr:hypothetical protein [Alisedimentitalea sp. MJ-SS2]MDU8928203.1 hypothetical protein [Alisedimentitalea sp. MJ-SS2]
MKYKRKFKLNPHDIDLIENCLSKELHHRSEVFLQSEKQHDTDAMDAAKSGISEITELLAKLHDQKNWYGHDPKNRPVPMG